MIFLTKFVESRPGKTAAALLLFALFATLFAIPQQTRAAATVIFLTSGTSWTVPSDWNSSSNSIEVIGAGGGGGAGSSATPRGGAAGGGGAYSKVSNVSLTPSASVAYTVGAAGSAGSSNGAAGNSGGDTYFCNSTSNCSSISGTAVVVGAKGGGGGASPATSATGGAGGAAGSGVGTTKYSGGTGGGIGRTPMDTGAGGGGAAGPNGAGNNGTGGNEGGGGVGGGSGDAGLGGAGGACGSPGQGGVAGSPGTEWDATHGSGGGGCGPATDGGLVGGAGGNYGGGGGSGNSTGSSGGAGKQGIIVITYTPVLPSPRVTITTNSTINGNASVITGLYKGSGTFVIDHPLDPKNKLLFHSFVESPDATNMYDGIANLDEEGRATIQLPGYFLTLNEDFKYFLMAIGEPMPGLHISRQIKRRYFFGLFGPPVFQIAGGASGGRVSWQVNGVRRDPYIMKHPIVPEVEKGPGQTVDVGYYLFPEFYATH